jgi:hypothetical protein
MERRAALLVFTPRGVARFSGSVLATRRSITASCNFGPRFYSGLSAFAGRRFLSQLLAGGLLGRRAEPRSSRRVLARHGSGRRPCPAIKTPHERAPRWAGLGIYGYSGCACQAEKVAAFDGFGRPMNRPANFRGTMINIDLTIRRKNMNQRELIREIIVGKIWQITACPRAC